MKYVKETFTREVWVFEVSGQVFIQPYGITVTCKKDKLFIPCHFKKQVAYPVVPIKRQHLYTGHISNLRHSWVFFVAPILCDSQLVLTIFFLFVLVIFLQ